MGSEHCSALRQDEHPDQLRGRHAALHRIKDRAGVKDDVQASPLQVGDLELQGWPVDLD
jgi:hypothetical protein